MFIHDYTSMKDFLSAGIYLTRIIIEVIIFSVGQFFGVECEERNA